MFNVGDEVCIYRERGFDEITHIHKVGDVGTVVELAGEAAIKVRVGKMNQWVSEGCLELYNPSLENE